MPDDYISIRKTLKGAITDFLEQEKMLCPATVNGLVDIINALSLYREEGHVLFPKIFIFDDFPTILKILSRNEYLEIDKGKREGSTFLKVLKKCAPLAQGGWDIYIWRKKKTLRYGLIKSIGSTLTLSIEDMLIKNGEQIPVILAHQISEKNVIVSGSSGNSVFVNFGATKDEEKPSLEGLLKLVKLITSSISEEIREQAELFYDRLFALTLREGHGTLAAVISHEQTKIPNQFNDCTKLSPPLKITDKVLTLVNTGDIDSNSRLEACTSLIRGMLLSDGITLFNTRGEVLAYRIFLKHRKAVSKKDSGGARSRTFEILESMVGNQILGAFMQSQDGAIHYRGNE